MMRVPKRPILGEPKSKKPGETIREWRARLKMDLLRRKKRSARL